MPIRVLMLYDVDGWAFHNECLALAGHLERRHPRRFVVDICRTARAPADRGCYDVLYSSSHLWLDGADHPRSVSQVSSHAYWLRKRQPGGWPHLRRWKYMVAKNSRLRELLTADDHPRVTRLYNPIDPARWSPGNPPSHEEFRVGFAGHAEQAFKGCHLIRAAVGRLPGCALDVADWGARRPPACMPDFYRGLDVYACMSAPDRDAGPMPPIEAALCGVPVITTRVGQIGEMVEDGVTGLVVERSAEALAEAIARLRSDSALRTRLARQAREVFLRQWVVEVGDAWADYFLAIVEIPPPVTDPAGRDCACWDRSGRARSPHRR